MSGPPSGPDVAPARPARARLLLLDGPTGAGKSSLLEYLRREHADCVYIGRKYTTRARRAGDNDWEFRFVDEIPPEKGIYTFASVSNRYAVDVTDILAADAQNKIYCVTCTDANTARRLRADFRATVVYVYRPLDEAELDGLLRSRGTSDASDAGARRREIEQSADEYLSKIDYIDRVLINVRDEAFLHRQMQAVLYTMAANRRSEGDAS